MKITIEQNLLDQAAESRYTLLGVTHGLYSYDVRSNLHHKLSMLGITMDMINNGEVVVWRGARAGKHINDGYYLYIFATPEINRGMKCQS